MNHLMDFDPCMIGERNQQMHTEIDSLRLQEWLRMYRDECNSVAGGLRPPERRLGTRRRDGTV